MADATSADRPTKPVDAGLDSGKPKPSGGGSLLRFREDVEPVTRVQDALPRVFIPPFRDCREPRPGEPGRGQDGKVCTNVAISGSTEAGRYFPDYGSCEVVMTQRPYWPAKPARESDPSDRRLQDPAYLSEIAWVTEQVRTSGCVCCHDAKAMPEGKTPSQWDVARGPLWLDSLSDTGLALFAGLADSSSLGAYRPEDNNGFDRNLLGIPTDDVARMERFLLAELSRRGISEDTARAVPPFGGPIYTNRITKPVLCGVGEGIDPGGGLHWNGAGARYVYVLEADTENPGVPPNLDLPKGTLFRLDVLPNSAPVESGLAYGTTPEGSFQAYPESVPASALTKGKTYHLSVWGDVGLPLVNCLMEFGRELEKAAPLAADAGVVRSDASNPSVSDGAIRQCALPGGDGQGFGAACKDSTNHSDCTCAADYCAIQPGMSTGYCTKRGCKEDAALCPSGFMCFDLSVFAPGQPAFCAKK